MDSRLIQDLANVSIRRGCGFGAIGIFTAMVGFSAEPYLAVRVGAFFVTVAALILYWRGCNAPQRNFRETEVWLMIRNTAPAVPKDRLQRLIGGALAESYFHHARIAAHIGLGMWGIALLVWAARKL